MIIEANRELCVCEIVDSLQMPFYTISRHIKELKNAEILEETRDGKYILYSFPAKKDAFLDALLELVAAIPNKHFSTDIKQLKKRLKLCTRGKCIIGISETGASGKRS